MIRSKIKNWLLGALAFLVMVLGFLATKRKADVAEAKEDMAKRNEASSNAQLNQLEKAQSAARDSGAATQQEVDDVEKNIDAGDLGGMDSKF